ncbi:unnamed protein product [Owenia fusiformis]|uniref:Uncharacterized protein n=1 Tax=Owenia fusiformis TaxID=6347 RepID=A0A8J1T4R8_OWEFU|nr:unnamed protein product [Owenia fusiformis]
MASDLLHKLCAQITGLQDDAAVDRHFQYALRILGSNFNSSSEDNEFEIAERIKKKLARQRREKDAAIFTELHRKLQGQGVVQNRGAVLQLLNSLSQDRPTSRLRGQAAQKNIFGQSLMKPHATSTPFGVNPPPSRTPAPGGSMTQGSTLSTGSSGISSIHSSARSDPSFEPQSLPPSYLPTPAQHRTPFGARLAWTLSKESGDKSSTVSRTGANSASKSQAQSVSRELHKLTMQENTSFEVSESVLLREIVYIFQGIEGQLIKLQVTKDGYRIDPKAGIPKAVRKTVGKLAECGWLYNKVRKYCDTRSTDKAFGLVGQSFCAALHQELTEYYRLMAIIEAQLQQEEDQGIDMAEQLTLRKLAVWTTEPLVRMKTLAALVDICTGKKGGALASAIYSYTQHGDPFVQDIIRHTLRLVVQPVYGTVLKWMFDGELEDNFHEFFVAGNPTVKNIRLWHDKYSLRKPMIPSFITQEQARKILLAGKSINFLRQLCQDRVNMRERDTVKKVITNNVECMFTQDLNSSFDKFVDVVYKETSSHLLEVLRTKYKFLEHLQAMRRYLLLGQGDFIRHLMDLLEDDLAKPASNLFLHNLTGILETAIRSTNAQFDDPDILKRLDVRLLEVSHGDTGWDVFSLDYHVDGPISTVFTSECIMLYLQVFNFLWRAKRMEYSLAGIWKGQMANAKLYRRLPELSPVLHQCHVLGCEMIHFIQQVQYYINFEVLECSWDELLSKVTSGEDLDYVIAAHQEFLDTIITRSLLDEKSRGILTQLRVIFDLIVQFQQIQDAMYQTAEDERLARQAFQDHQKSRSEKGEWAMTANEEKAEKQRMKEFQRGFISSTAAKLRVLSQSYQDMVQQFLVMLQSHSDVSLRFLSFRLDFNEHYREKEPKLRSPMAFQKVKKRTF